jgi:hypothetical protein
MRRTVLVLLAAAATVLPQQVNPDSVLIQDFESRIADYVKLQHHAEGSIRALKPTASSEKIPHHEHELAEQIRKTRGNVAQGNIFTPEIAAEFRRLIALAMKGSDSAHVQQSLRHAEPVRIPLQVDKSWPNTVPLQSTPPTLLMNLPNLDPGLDYRVVGHNLVLRDAKANLIVDFLSDVIP